MLLVLEDEHKEHLNFLVSVDVEGRCVHFVDINTEEMIHNIPVSVITGKIDLLRALLSVAITKKKKNYVYTSLL